MRKNDLILKPYPMMQQGGNNVKGVWRHIVSFL